MRLGFFVDSVPFTADVIAGRASLGGSESACLGLCRALAKRGHEVHIFATKLDDVCQGADHGGVVWHHAETLLDVGRFIDWDVFCSLRMPHVFGSNIRARYRVLWNQDLLIGEQAKHLVMSVAWAIDAIVYVSAYHRKQWEGVLPELTPLGWVTKNGYDPSLVPTDAVTDPKRIIHITRPERGLGPLLQMWPALRERVPDAELHVCRYNSMYDAGGWGKICAQFDEMVSIVNQQVGGITYLGELGKADLYREIAEAAVMWYPGVVDFAETSCIAAIESQANGTPFVGSWKGALPETVPSGVLLTGDATSPEYQIASVQAVVTLLNDCQRQARSYREVQQAGREHAANYRYDVIAYEWERWLERSFDARQGVGVLRRLLHEDDHTAALRVVERMGVTTKPDDEAFEAAQLCRQVIAGESHTSEDYAAYALPDPLIEWETSGRFQSVAPLFADCTRVLDIACGNGSFPIGLALTHPTIRVVGVDYAEGNIVKAREAAERAGVADRVTFVHATVWDFAEQALHIDLADRIGGLRPFDGLFVGEFLEHVADAPGLIDSVEAFVKPNALVVYTVPNGPFIELLERRFPRKRGHVHHFQQDDLTTVFGLKRDVQFQYFDCGKTPRGSQVGHWFIQYLAEAGRPAKARPYTHRILTTRPKPTLSVGIIAQNNATDIARCVESVWPIADEIVVGDTGSTDGSMDIARQYGAKVIPLSPVADDPDGFAGVRNKVLATCTGDWFLWIDTDEILVGGEQLWKYLDTALYHGYSIRQNHLSLDMPLTWDKPIRLFRRRPDIQFAGCIHEQPYMGDVNRDIMPALEVMDVQIAHTGYLVEGQRRWKMLHRNLPLLAMDQQRFPDRRLGKLLVLRDYVNLGDYEREMAGGNLTPAAKQYYAKAIGLFEKEWLRKWSDKYYALARPFYEMALKAGVAGIFEFEVCLAGRQYTMGTAKAKPERIVVRKREDIRAEIVHRIDAMDQQATPTPVDVKPIVPVREPAPVEAA